MPCLRIRTPVSALRSHPYVDAHIFDCGGECLAGPCQRGGVRPGARRQTPGGGSSVDAVIGLNLIFISLSQIDFAG